MYPDPQPTPGSLRTYVRTYSPKIFQHNRTQSGSKSKVRSPTCCTLETLIAWPSAIYSSFQRWKNFEYRLGFDKAIAISLVVHFLGHSVVCFLWFTTVKQCCYIARKQEYFVFLLRNIVWEAFLNDKIVLVNHHPTRAVVLSSITWSNLILNRHKSKDYYSHPQSP